MFLKRQIHFFPDLFYYVKNDAKSALLAFYRLRWSW